uniref:Uncharacterized protein n=1 Tax=Arundo donax TaxID=35708 RepID=A0A0A9H907_ARUDO
MRKLHKKYAKKKEKNEEEGIKNLVLR